MKISKIKKKYWIIFSSILLIFILFKIQHMGVYLSDENTYFYMGKLVSEGNIPYKDFFFSHPPMQLFIFALILKIFGFNFVLLKSVAIASTIISCIFLFKTVNEKYNNLEGIIAVILFLSAQTTLYNSSINFGVNIATMFSVIGFYYFYTKKKIFISGVFFGFAGLTALYSLVPFAVLSVTLFFSDKKKIKRFIYGFSLTFLIPILLITLITGIQFLIQIFLYHILKAPLASTDKLFFIKELIRKNYFLFLSSFSYLFIKNKKELNIIGIISLTYLIFIMSLKTSFEFYFIPIFPFLAILGARSIGTIIPKRKLLSKILIIIITIILIFYIIDFNIKPLKDYDELYSFESWQEVSDYITINSDSDERIFGDYFITPIVAMTSNRKIASNIVDNHYETIFSGVINVNQTIKELKNNKVRYILIHERDNIQPFWSSYEINKFIKENCGFNKAIKSFSDYSNNYYIFNCSYS